MSTFLTYFYRLDPLTGCNNFLSFVEALDCMSFEADKQPFSILLLDMNDLKMLNETRGHAYGDSVLRWLGIAPQEESHVTAYRMGDDEFAVILTDGSQTEYKELLNRLFDRLNWEGGPLGIPTPASTMNLRGIKHCNATAT